MTNSILDSVKKVLGISPEYTVKWDAFLGGDEGAVYGAPLGGIVT